MVLPQGALGYPEHSEQDQGEIEVEKKNGPGDFPHSGQQIERINDDDQQKIGQSHGLQELQHVLQAEESPGDVVEAVQGDHRDRHRQDDADPHPQALGEFSRDIPVEAEPEGKINGKGDQDDVGG